MSAPGIDGTPGWAYDEDGYCVCCGNGRWKHHMPECELRDLLSVQDTRPDWETNTEEIRTWIAGGAVSTNRLVRELRLWLRFWTAPDEFREDR